MIAFGISQEGSFHKQLGMECQDHCRIKSIGNRQVAVIADGLGSAIYSGAASSLACDSVIDTAQELLSHPDVFTDTLEIIKTCFCVACARILQFADSKDMPLAHFETTLSVVIADENEITYGHIGDGGISLLTADAQMKLLTYRQNGVEESSVFPLLSQFQRCVFGRVRKSWDVLMLATDGMLNFFSSIQDSANLRRYLSSFFMPMFDERHAVRRQLQNHLERTLEDEDLLQIVEDDRTLVFVVNENRIPDPDYSIDFSDNPNQRSFDFETGRMVFPVYFEKICERFFLDPTRFFHHIAALPEVAAPAQNEDPVNEEIFEKEQPQDEMQIIENDKEALTTVVANDTGDSETSNTTNRNDPNANGKTKRKKQTSSPGNKKEMKSRIRGIIALIVIIAAVLAAAMIVAWGISAKKPAFSRRNDQSVHSSQDNTESHSIPAKNRGL